MAHPLPLCAADRALMRPPNALGKSHNNATGTSFLRRTEYITSSTTGGSKFESSNSSNTMRVRRKRKLQDTSVDDPINISRHILKGFNLAYPADAYNGQDSAENIRAADITAEERQAWNKPKHPKNPNLKLLESYPLLPDWDAMTDTGAYMVFKYMAAPVNNPLDPSYDTRIDVALLRPAGQSVKDQELYMQEKEAQKDDPTAPAPVFARASARTSRQKWHATRWSASVSSSTGTNSSGVTRPCSGSSQRMRASTPTTCPVARRTIGW